MVSKAFAIIGSGNGLKYVSCKATIWRNACLVSVGPSGQISLEFYWKYNHFNPTKCIWKCCQLHDGHFFQAGLNVSTLCVGIYFSKQKYIRNFLSFLDTGMLNYWGRVTNICVGKLTIISSDNGLLPGRRQAIIWTNDGILLMGTLGTNFSEILIEILIFWFKKMHLKVSSAKRRPFCLGLNVLTNSLCPSDTIWCWWSQIRW